MLSDVKQQILRRHLKAPKHCSNTLCAISTPHSRCIIIFCSATSHESKVRDNLLLDCAEHPSFVNSVLLLLLPRCSFIFHLRFLSTNTAWFRDEVDLATVQARSLVSCAKFLLDSIHIDILRTAASFGLLRAVVAFGAGST